MIPAILGALGAASEAGAGVSALTMFGGGPPPVPGSGGLRSIFEAGRAVEGLGNNASKLNQAITPLNPSMQKFVGAITVLPRQLLQAEAAITTTFDTFVRGLSDPIDTVKQLGDSVSRFVRLSNPAAVSLFEYRIENAFSAVGRVLEPILQSLGRAADSANVAMSKLAPAFQPLVSLTVEIADDVSNSLVPAMRELAPVVKELSADLLVTYNATKFLIPNMHVISGVFASMNSALKFFGGSGFDEKAGASVAARPAHLTGGIEDIQRRGAEASLTATAAAGRPAPQTTESLLDQILQFLKNLTTAEGWEAVGRAIAAAIERHLPNLPRIPGGPEELGMGVGAILAHLRG